MAELDGPQQIVEALHQGGINFVTSLPDINLSKLLRLIETDEKFIHVPLCREEEGVGVCAGAYIGGKRAAIILQGAGMLNSCNALTTTSLQFHIPVLLLIYYAGDLGDQGFSVVGGVTEPVLAALGIRFYVLRETSRILPTITKACVLAEDSCRPVAVLLTKDVLGRS